eukprot:8881202-Alexandrium_andersonii.AAC.1
MLSARCAENATAPCFRPAGYVSLMRAFPPSVSAGLMASRPRTTRASTSGNCACTTSIRGSGA